MIVKLERLAWTTAITVLVVALVWTYSADKSLRAAVLAGEFERVYASSALESFSRDQGVDKSKVLKDFYMMHIGMSDRSCIGFVPKQSVTGGATTYCYTKKPPIRLIGIDREGD